ncbi:MAG: flagellar assembly protein FliW [Cyanobacteria bacterium HKST-UBA05]|nr:flagellar assembly protein FliW [Cyanobacteria bacterium HKST-UBA05]
MSILLMGKVTLETSRFGVVEIEENSVLSFYKPILGFERLNRFTLLDHQPDSPFKWLQSIEDGELAFVVTHPGLFGIHYEFEIPDAAVEALDIQDVAEVLVLSLVTIPEQDPSQMTANLTAPIVINQRNYRAMQLVLDSDKYGLKTPLLGHLEVLSGEACEADEAGEG